MSGINLLKCCCEEEPPECWCGVPGSPYSVTLSGALFGGINCDKGLPGNIDVGLPVYCSDYYTDDYGSIVIGAINYRILADIYFSRFCKLGTDIDVGLTLKTKHSGTKNCSNDPRDDFDSCHYMQYGDCECPNCLYFHVQPHQIIVVQEANGDVIVTAPGYTFHRCWQYYKPLRFMWLTPLIRIRCL